MTAVASAATAIPVFDGEVTVAGARYRLDREGDALWVELADPDRRGPPDGRRIRRPVSLVTGSHHQQVFWYATGQSRVLGQVPITWLVDEQRWIPRRSAFVHPSVPGVVPETGHWSAVCLGCHTTNGKARLATPPGDAPLAAIPADSRVSEFGIACEACHGPGEAHVAANRNPLRRYRLRAMGAHDETATLPSRLAPAASADVCGQCHSVWEWPDARAERIENDRGVRYRPGSVLADSRFVARPAHNRDAPTMRALVEGDPDFIADSFWPDGMVSVSGREYNGLLDSACHARGPDAARTMTCLSCHALHAPGGTTGDTALAAWADDQLKPGMRGNAACVQCHDAIGRDVPAHTHHPAASSGSACYNCHMPYTTYGLMKGIRSHQVSSPSVQVAQRTGRPDACSLCHLDKSLLWTAEALSTWYRAPRAVLDDEARTVPAAARWLLSGDAQQRALVAYSFGWADARKASGTTWMAPLLARLLDDPYDAVRFIAFRSLRTLPGFERAAYDFVGPPADRRAAAARLLRQWQEAPGGGAGIVSADAVERLVKGRNDRRVFLRE